MSSTVSSKAEIVDRLLDIVAREGMVERDKLRMEAELDTLGVKSADIVMILVAIEDEFGTYISIDSDMAQIKTVGELVDVIVARIGADAGK